MAISFSDLGGGGGGASTNLVGPGSYTLDIPAGAFRIETSHDLVVGARTYPAGTTVTYEASGITSATLDGPLGTALVDFGTDTVTFSLGVAKGNGVYMLAGNSSGYATSTDGETWTVRTAPTTATMLGLTFGAGVFAYCTSTQIYTSPDAITWTLRHSFTDSREPSSASDGGGIFNEGTSFMVPLQGPSVNGAVAYSNDSGVTWTQTLLNTGFRSWGGYMEDNFWIIGADSGRIYYSTNNGASWTTVDTGTSNNNYGITKHGGLYVFALAAGQIRTSPNGINSFTTRTSGLGTATLNIAVSGFGKAWIRGGANLISSPDGITWTNTGLSVADGTVVRPLDIGLAIVRQPLTTKILPLIQNSALAIIEPLGEVTLPNA